MTTSKKWLLTLALITSVVGVKGQTNLADSLLVEAQKHIESGEYSDAKVELIRGNSIDRKNASILNELAYCYYQTNKYKIAIEYANKLIKLKTPLSADGYVTKCAALEAMGKNTEALKNYKKGIEIYPEKHKLNQNYALLCYARHDYSNAEYYAGQAVLTSKADAESHLLLSQIAIKQGIRSKALLASIYYALLEQDEAKSIIAYTTVKKLWWEVASNDGKNLMRMADSNTDINGLGGVEKMINSINSGFTIHISPETEIETLTNSNTQLFKYLSDKKETHLGDFWWDFYANAFTTINHLGYTPQLSLYLARNIYKPEVLSTVAKEIDQFSKFTYWLEIQTFTNQ